MNTYKHHQDLEQQLEAARIYLKEEAAADPDMAGEGLAAVCVFFGGGCGGKERALNVRHRRTPSLRSQEQQLQAGRIYLKEEAAADPDMAGEGAWCCLCVWGGGGWR